MGAPAEILEEIFTVIEGGKTIGESAQIIQFPSDSGTRTFPALEMTFKGTNGTGLNYWVSAVAQGAAAISAGAIMVAVSIPEFLALAVPCLGVAVGTAWYNIDPDGWTNLALLLSDAGWTVKNKVVGYMIDKGVISFTPETLDILIGELTRLGLFDDSSEWNGDKPESFLIEDYIYASDKTFLGGAVTPTLVYYNGTVYRSGYYEARGYYITSENQPSDLKVTSAADDDILRSLICSKEHFTAAVYGYDTTDLHFTSFSQTNTYSYTYDNKTVYYAPNNYDYMVTDSYGTNVNNFAENVIGQLAWIIQYGTFEDGEYKELLQNGANLPDPKVPVRTKYPDWIPWEFPDLTGWQIPMVMPVQYPGLLPIEEEPYQDPAQNPEADPDEQAEKGQEILEDPSKNPKNEEHTDDDQEEDEEEQPEPEDPLPDEEEVVNPDPIEPDPPIPPSPIIPAPTLPDTVSSSKLFTVYNPNSAQLGLLGGYLWDDNLIEILKKIWQNPLDGIISLIQVYVTPDTSGSSNIILGYLDSGVSAALVSNQFKTIDCGSITVPELNENCLDYIPYTKMELYLPFIGITEIDTNEFMSGTISIKYVVDVYTGTCLAQVKCTRSRDLSNGAILYTFSGNCSQQIPLTSGDARGVFGALVSAVGLGLSVATGGATAMMAAGSAAGLASREMLHVSHSGNLSANAGIMGQKKPYLIINRERPYTANSYNSFYGYPANKTINIGNYNGFLKVKACKLKGSATEAEKQEIMQLLTTGIFA